MEADLVPMSMADIFDEAFDLYKRNFALFAGVVAVVHVPASIIQDAVYYGLRLDRFAPSAVKTENDVYAFLGFMVVVLLMLLLYSFLLVVQNGALALAVSNRYLGRPATIGGSYRQTLPYLLRLLLTWGAVGTAMALVGGVILFITAFVLAMVVAALESLGVSASVAATVAGATLLVACGAAGIVTALWLGAFVTQAVVIEGRAFGSALGRNWQLLKGRTLRLMGATVVLLLILVALLLALDTSMGYLLEWLVYPAVNPPEMVRTIISDAWRAIVWMFLQPYWMICLTLMYYDQRVRREGFDLALLEQQVAPRVVPEPAR